jgi:hypothetical protein
MKRKCVGCNRHFKPRVPHHLFHSKRCCDGYNRGKSWPVYFTRLLQTRSTSRKALSIEFLLSLFEEQGGKCALSGIELTRISGKGQVETNASLDRIDPKGGYVPDNVRLVCGFVNSFRGTSSDKQFIWWCKQIVKHNVKQSKR